MNDFDSHAEQSTYSTVDADGAAALDAVDVGDENRGLYGKYRVERVDGKRKGPYFVLAYTSDPHAAVALAATPIPAPCSTRSWRLTCAPRWRSLPAESRGSRAGVPSGCQILARGCAQAEGGDDLNGHTAIRDESDAARDVSDRSVCPPSGWRRNFDV